MTDWGYALAALTFFVAALGISLRLRRAPRPWPRTALLAVSLLVFAAAFLAKTSNSASTGILAISIAFAIVGSLLLLSFAAMMALLAVVRRRRGGR